MGLMRCAPKLFAGGFRRRLRVKTKDTSKDEDKDKDKGNGKGDKKAARHLQAKMLTLLKYHKKKGKDDEKKRKAETCLEKYAMLKDKKKSAFAAMFDSEGGLGSDMAWTHKFVDTHGDYKDEQQLEVCNYYTANLKCFMNNVVFVFIKYMCVFICITLVFLEPM